jgi:hypothetical protein
VGGAGLETPCSAAECWGMLGLSIDAGAPCSSGSLGGSTSFVVPGRVGRTMPQRLAETEPRQRTLYDAQRANQIALERFEQ